MRFAYVNLNGDGKLKDGTIVKAIRVHAPGGPDALRYEDVERPAPRPGQALVKIEAAGVNFIDVYQRTGRYPVATPFTPGQEAPESWPRWARASRTLPLAPASPTRT